MSEESQNIALIRHALDQFAESVAELSSTQAEQGARLTAAENALAKMQTAINGSDDGGPSAPGIKTRLALLEREASQAPRPERSGASEALATVEKARAEVDKARWGTALALVKAAAPTIAALAASLLAHLAWK